MTCTQYGLSDVQGWQLALVGHQGEKASGKEQVSSAWCNNVMVSCISACKWAEICIKKRGRATQIHGDAVTCLWSACWSIRGGWYQPSFQRRLISFTHLFPFYRGGLLGFFPLSFMGCLSYIISTIRKNNGCESSLSLLTMGKLEETLWRCLELSSRFLWVILELSWGNV